jgi:hypothetical protein
VSLVGATAPGGDEHRDHEGQYQLRYRNAVQVLVDAQGKTASAMPVTALAIIPNLVTSWLSGDKYVGPIGSVFSRGRLTVVQCGA